MAFNYTVHNNTPHYNKNIMKAEFLLNYCSLKANPTDLICRCTEHLLREGENSGHAAFLKIKFHVAIYQKVIQKDTLK